MPKVRKPGTRPLLVVLSAIALAISYPASAEGQKICRKGKPCGNTCIARNRTCHVGKGTARQASPASSTASHSVAVPEGMLYVASTKGGTYYYVGCRGWRSLSAANLRWFATREEAVEAGLRPSMQPGCSGPPEALSSLEAVRFLLTDAFEEVSKPPFWRPRQTVWSKSMPRRTA